MNEAIRTLLDEMCWYLSMECHEHAMPRETVSKWLVRLEAALLHAGEVPQPAKLLEISDLNNRWNKLALEEAERERLALDLDPGIRDEVVRLRRLGFETCDSGDGVTKIAAGWTPYDDALPYPHIVCVSSEAMFFRDARRLRELMPDWDVQATYSPLDGKYLILLSKEVGALPPVQTERTTP